MEKKKRVRPRRSFTFNGQRYWAEGKTVEEAEANKKLMKYQLKNGLYVDGDLTVAQLSELWLDQIQKRKTTDKTYKGKRSIVKNAINPIIGGVKVSQIKQIHVVQVLDDAAEKYSQGHLDKIYSALHGMFNLALANRFCVTDPCFALEKPQGQDNAIRREATVLERNTYIGYLLWLDMVILCGLRPGETSEIRFEDIHEGYMWVNGTKNANAKRFVPLPDGLRQEILSVPHTFGSEYVCRMRDNRRSREWLDLVNEIGMPESDLVPYCFRHSYVTDLENCPGLSQAAIKKIAGHKVEGITDRYTHSRPETCLEAFPLILAYWDKIGFQSGESVTMVTEVDEIGANSGKVKKTRKDATA